MVEQPEPRSPLGVGLDLASRVTTIGLEFALPAGAGYGLDRWLGTMPGLTVAGVVLGFLVGMQHAVRMSRELTGGAMGPGSDQAPGGRPDRASGANDDPGRASTL